jgi:hypothetical protein
MSRDKSYFKFHQFSKFSLSILAIIWVQPLSLVEFISLKVYYSLSGSDQLNLYQNRTKGPLICVVNYSKNNYFPNKNSGKIVYYPLLGSDQLNLHHNKTKGPLIMWLIIRRIISFQIRTVERLCTLH